MTKFSSRSVLATAIALMVLASPLRAQLPTMSDMDRSSATPATGPLPTWDVAMVKPHSVEDGTMSWQTTADGLRMVNLALEQLVCSAWDMKPYQVSGLTGWMQSSRFDLTAKVAGDDVPAYKKLRGKQRDEMLQKLLIDRFQLKVHTETKTLPVYDLVVDKGGSKLVPTTAIEPASEEERRANPGKYKKGSMMMGPGRFEGTGVRVDALASQLANALGRPVNDATGLTGAYDITLHYRQDEAAATDDTPSVFAAVQEQLGLKLISSKGPVETLVVDAAQKPDAD